MGQQKKTHAGTFKSVVFSNMHPKKRCMYISNLCNRVYKISVNRFNSINTKSDKPAISRNRLLLHLLDLR